MKTTMTAIIKANTEPGFTKTTKPIPSDLKKDEALIKVLATSVCGTDVHIYESDAWSKSRIKPPMTVGHEFAGEVIAMGSDVRNVAIGDIVSAETHIVCGVCEFCRRGEGHICINTKILGVDTDGCFAEYVKVPASNLIVNSKDIDPKYLSIQEPFGNAVHTMLEFDIIGKTVAVVGCGPIGLMGVNIAKAVGASKIIAIDVKPYRLNKAKELGAHVVINPMHEDVIARVLEETGGLGVDVATEFSGNKMAIEQMFQYVKFGGKVSMLGLPSQNIDLNVSRDIVFKGITIYGVVGRKMYSTWDQTKGLLASGRIDLDKIVTHTFKLEEYDEALALMMSGESGKIVLIP